LLEKTRIATGGGIKGGINSGAGLLSIIPGIIPETLSVGIYSSGQMLLDWFGPHTSGGIQHILFYLGQITICFIAFALIYPVGKKTKFWLIFGSLMTGWAILVNPFFQISSLLASPVLHPFVPLSWVPIAFATIVANTGLHLENKDFKIEKKNINYFFFIMLSIILIGLLGYGLLEPRYFKHTNWYKIASLLSVVSLFIVWQLQSNTKKFELWIPRIAIAITLLMAVMISPHIYQSINSPSFLYQEGLIACFITVVATMGTVLLVNAPLKKQRSWKAWFWIGFSIVALIVWKAGQVRVRLPGETAPEVIRTLVTFGELRLFLTIITILFIFSKVRTGTLRKRYVVPIFLLLLSVDLLSFGNYFDRFSTSQQFRPVRQNRLYYNAPLDYADVSTQGRIPSRGYTPTPVSELPTIPGDQIHTQFTLNQETQNGTRGILHYSFPTSNRDQEIWVKVQSDKPAAFQLIVESGQQIISKDYVVVDNSEVWITTGVIPFPVQGSVDIKINPFDSEKISIQKVVAVKSQNLLTNTNFEGPHKNKIDGWNVTNTFKPYRNNKSELIIKNNEAGNISQVTSLSNISPAGLNPRLRRFTLGAWVKASKQDTIRLRLISRAAKSSGSFRSKGQVFDSKRNKEKNKWEWLSVTMDATIGVGMLVNLHSQIESLKPGELSISNPILWEHAGGELKVIDNKRFRANNPLRLFGIEAHEPHTNSPMSAGIRTYGGFTSSTSHFLLELVKGLAPTWKNFRGSAGLAFDISDDRLLDILGVGYDWQDITRPNPLSRLMLFQDFEVIEEEQETIERMKDPEFYPLQTIILSQTPDLTPRKIRSSHLDFPNPLNNKVKVNLSSDQPALLLFNDSYHPDWVAYVNGVQKPIIRANHAFMATVVPAGTSSVEFVFEPRMFHFSKYLTFIGLILLTIGVLGFFRFPPKSI